MDGIDSLLLPLDNLAFCGIYTRFTRYGCGLCLVGAFAADPLMAVNNTV